MKKKHTWKPWFSCDFKLEGTLKRDHTRITAAFPCRDFHPMQFLLRRKFLNSSLKYTLLPGNKGYGRAATCTLQVGGSSPGIALLRIPRCPTPSCCTLPRPHHPVTHLDIHLGRDGRVDVPKAMAVVHLLLQRRGWTSPRRAAPVPQPGQWPIDHMEPTSTLQYVL